MIVWVDSQQVALTDKDVIGAGGEGVIYRWGTRRVIKWYHHPTSLRGQKLQAMLAQPPSAAADRVYAPIALAYGSPGALIGGLAMKRIGDGYEPLAALANKKFRNRVPITARQIANLFLDGGTTVQAAHASGYCIGDFNDFNEKFQGSVMVFLDVDAWQFGSYPCPVAKEQFLHPDLYRIDLGARPVFKPEHDWFSYAVLLYKSLLLVHPFGGVHRHVKQLIERVEQGIMVTDSGVIYPGVGFSPDLLDDDLSHAFYLALKLKQRGAFPLSVVRAYANGLIDCPACGAAYPAQRAGCPLCSAVRVAPVPAPRAAVQFETVFKTNGPILFAKRLGNRLVVLAREHHQAVRYEWAGTLQRTEMGPYEPGTRYEMTAQFLVAARQRRVDLTGSTPGSSLAIGSYPTETFVLTGHEAMRASARYVFRIAAGQLLYGETPMLHYVERAVRPVMAEHTWFAVRQDTNDKPTVAGFMQVGRAQHWFLVYEGLSYDHLPLTPLEVGESQADVLVRFDNHGCLIERATEQDGGTYRHIATVDDQGRVSNRPRVKTDEPLPHGSIYQRGILLRATDAGIVQENLFTGAVKTFSVPPGILADGDTLIAASDGLFAVQSDRVLHLQIT